MIYIIYFHVSDMDRCASVHTSVSQPRLDSIIENTPSDLLIEIILVPWSISFAAQLSRDSIEAKTRICATFDLLIYIKSFAIYRITTNYRIVN